MSAALNLTETQIITDLRALLLDILPTGTAPAGTEVIRGQVNKVAAPTKLNYVVMTPTARPRLATNVDSWSNASPSPTVIASAQSTEIDVQLDVHGPLSADNGQIISTLLRDEYACTFLSNLGHGVQPLYSDDPRQLPFINGQDQYEDRWVILARLQATPVVSTPMQFANTLSATLIEVDTAYPPEA